MFIQAIRMVFAEETFFPVLQEFLIPVQVFPVVPQYSKRKLLIPLSLDYAAIRGRRTNLKSQSQEGES